MEVLGAVASSLALLEISLKTANFLQGISNIQSDYEDLKLQIVNINAIIKDFQNVPRLFPNIPGLPQLSEPLSMALADQQLQDIKKELDDIATYCADDKRSQAKKAKWILKRNRIATLTQKARDAKSNLQMAMGCQTASLSAIQCIAGHRSHLDVIAALQSLRYIQSTSLPPAPQPTLGEVTDSYIEESQTTTNADISKDSVDDGKSSASRETTYLQVSAVQFREQTGCLQGCRCRCHFNESSYRVPTWVQPLLGSLLLDYNQRSNRSKYLCSDPACACEGASLVSLQYRLPLWFQARTLLFKAAWSSLGLSLTLRPARVLDEKDVVWNWIERSSKSFRDPKGDNLVYFPNDVDRRGIGLIEYAISYDSFDVLELLLKLWANLLPKQGLPRETGYLANWWLQKTNLDARQVLLLRQVISYVDDISERKSTRVHEAALRGHGIREALREDMWAMDELDYTGRAPFHYACVLGCVEVVEELIRAKANVNQQDWSGMTPLMVAALYNRVECMRLFLKAGCNIQQDNEGDCAIHYAAQRCSTDAVGLLLAAGASASARGLNGRTPLHLLAVNPASTKTDAIEKTIQLLLVTKDADLEARDINGHTPAMFALCESNLPVLRCLIEAGASLYTNDVYSQNTIHLTAMYAHIEVLEYLLSLDIKVFSGINPESLSTYDLTPWDYFLWTLQGSPFQMGSRRRPSPAEQDAFASLYQALRDQVSRQEIRLLERAVEFLGQGHFDDARAQLSIIIDQKREWEQDDLAGWYRGIEKSIQLGEVESAIEILTDDIEECTTRIGASPWDIENRWGIKGPVVFSSSSEGGDDEEEETIHSEDEDGASESADDAAQASDEDGSETDEETGRIVTVDY